MNAQKLDLVIRLLDTADAIMQELDFDSELCYDLHNKIQDVVEELEDMKMMTDYIRDTTSHSAFDPQVFLGSMSRTCCISNIVLGVEL